MPWIDFRLGKHAGDAHRSPAKEPGQRWSLVARLLGERGTGVLPAPDSQAIRRRTSIAAIGLALWACGIEARLIKLQVFDRAEMVVLAERQQIRTPTLPA